jgi:hypothetical protein
VNALIAAVALLAATPVASQPSVNAVNGGIAARLLASHNQVRAAVGAPPLEWDATLASHSAAYGQVLASLRQLVHSPREGRPGERENLAMAWHGTMSPEQLVALWANERRLLGPGSFLFPGDSRTGRWEDIAHYTQMVWPTTTHVGCAIYSADWDYLVCRYSPPGNRDGKPMFVATSASGNRLSPRYFPSRSLP